MEAKELREKIAKAIGVDEKTPDYWMADQILNLFREEVDKLTVIGNAEITDAKQEAERLSWSHKAHPIYEKDKYLLQVQLNSIQEQLRSKLA